MSEFPEAPKSYKDFIAKYPELGDAWELVHQAGATGPLDKKTLRLIKLAIAIGAAREGAVRASARKAQADGVTKEELSQVIAAAVGTTGFPAAVAAYSWMRDELE